MASRPDHGFDRDVVLIATDHAHDSEVALAYDRGDRFGQRIALFTWWAEQLARAQAGGKANRSTMKEEVDESSL